MAKIDKFWVVIEPTKFSELGGICFECDIAGMMYQFLGGLRSSEIAGIYTTKKEAEKLAKKLLKTKLFKTVKI